jgi:hypothetical protein
VIFLASAGFLKGSIPATETVPLSGLKNPNSKFIVVVFPAPFGPRSAKISPSGISNEKLSRAKWLLNCLLTELSDIIAIYAIELHKYKSNNVAIARKDEKKLSAKQSFKS